MKKLLYFLFQLFITTVILSSCEDYLEKPPGVDVTEDLVFSGPEEIDYYIAGTYYYGVMSDFPYWDARDKNDTHWSPASDESEIFQSWYWCQEPWNQGMMNSSNNYATGDRRYSTHWTAIRRANIILERIDNAPFNDDAFKRRAKGEGYMIRALNYFELFRKYGGLPVLKKRLNPADELLIPRSSVGNVVDFIVEDCNEAIKLLPAPNTLTTAQRGRLTNVAAMALKARTLLYAASPTFNTAKPYLDSGGNNDLIIYGNYDKNRWKTAADAAQEAIDEALKSGHNLVVNKKDGNNDITYRYIWENPDNEEVILSDQSKGTMRFDNFPWGNNLPASCGGFGGGLSMTFNFVRLYEKKDGTPQTWNMEGGDDLMKKYGELDPRFAQTVAYHRQPWNATDNPSLDCSVDGRDKCLGGQYMHKPIPYTLSANPTTNVVPKGIIFRLGELYLNLAEALNEYSGTPPPAAYDAIDLIRTRSGMPPLTRNLTQSQFREKVRNERAIELCMEGHRLFDLRRWEIADTERIMKGNMYGLRIYNIEGSAECRYEPYVFEIRSFYPRMYRHPFTRTEIDKGYLIQNPGY